MKSERIEKISKILRYSERDKDILIEEIRALGGKKKQRRMLTGNCQSIICDIIKMS